MSGAGNNEVHKALSRVKTYLIATFVMLFFMALLSSLGKAFIYIFTGLAFFFVFLAWQNWRGVSSHTHDSKHRRTTVSSQSPFLEFVRAIFQAASAGGQSSSSMQDQSKRIVGIAASFIGGVFLLILVIVVFSDGNDSNRSTPELETSGESGDALYSLGNYDAAYRAYKREIQTAQSPAQAYYGLGNVKSVLNESDSALYYYNKALQIDRNYFQAAYGKGILFFNQKDYRKSLEEVKYIINKTDQNVEAYLLAADNHYYLQEYAAAINYYERAYNLGARSKELANIMAYIYDVNGDQQRAISFYKQTLGFDSAIVDVNRRLGELLPGEQGNIYRERAQDQR
jgi:tetratricopeptide (TPR) repeat protein